MPSFETSEILAVAIAHWSRQPLVGRMIQRGLRESVILHGQTGFVALYRFYADSRRDGADAGLSGRAHPEHVDRDFPELDDVASRGRAF